MSCEDHEGRLRRINWYRGFYRTWVVLSLLWVVLAGATAIYITYDQVSFEKRVAASRASDSEAWMRGDLLLTARGDVCTFDRNSWEVCSVDRTGRFSAAGVGLAWLSLFAIPAAFYGMLRGATWILRGFGRQP